MDGVISSNTRTSAARSPTQVHIQSAFLPTNGNHRLHLNHKYPSATAAASPTKSISHDLPPPPLLASPRLLYNPSTYQNEPQPEPRNYSDPTSGSSRNRTPGTAKWTEAQAHNSQVDLLIILTLNIKLILNSGLHTQRLYKYHSPIPISQRHIHISYYTIDTFSSFTI